MYRAPLTDVKRSLPLCRQRTHGGRSGLRRNHAAPDLSVRRTRAIGEHLHAIMPFARRAFSAISAVCIPCAAPLIITETS